MPPQPVEARSSFLRGIILRARSGSGATSRCTWRAAPRSGAARTFPTTTPTSKHLLYACGVQGRDPTRGRGVIHGNGPRFWDDGRLEAWLSGKEDLPRTRDMLRFEKCRNVCLEDVRGVSLRHY